ncbi:MAG: cation:proton antiporter [Rudaea sp.]|uniref:monovalent cation:proton antiporter-2 (CPA2) family protein n=1 Tax=unclassified Rudaea TaxID=2627037 RepID=UPI0010F8693E|nr:MULTISPECIES: monovalent cation:proton antiporter-2 (CPA2) family protein [unclassified Rudaea]MBN8885543.1 cation:proton antiporter [Rudaea sp.]MBR0346261.1 cation:proton antiporter [Rudaea sp.]
MEGSHFLQYMVMFLAAAVIAVALSKRAGLGAVLGYLGAGALIGPSFLDFAPDMSQANELSELGVILLLFVIGLELSPARLWLMRKAVFGAGLIQVVLSALILGGIAVTVGVTMSSAVIVGLALALSSTAIGLQILAERKEIGEPHGRLAFAILLFQDLAAIPILALVPLLGVHGTPEAGGNTWIAAAEAIGVIAVVAVGGRYLLRPVFRAVAATQIPEVFTAMALLVVFGAAWLMELAGMQMSLGAFLAGVLLADSEFRHEIEAQIEPFKGLLLGLFFVGVGVSLDLHLVKQQPVAIGLIVISLLAVKALVLLALGKVSGRLDFNESARLALVLAGGGEFAFVVLNLARDHRLLESGQHSLLVVAVTLSMALTPLLVIGGSKWLTERKKKPQPEFDVIPDQHPRVIIAGYGRVGQIIARVLRAQKIPFTALESSVEQVELVRRFNQNIYFGDSSRPELLRAAGIEKAEIFVLTTDDPELNIRTARIVKRLYPHIKIIARARNRQHVWRLMDLSIDGIVRDTFYSSLVMAKGVLVDLGIAPEIAKARIDIFRKRDEQLLRDQHLVYDDDAALLQTAKDALADLDRLFEADERPAEIEASTEEEDEKAMIPGTP